MPGMIPDPMDQVRRAMDPMTKVNEQLRPSNPPPIRPVQPLIPKPAPPLFPK